MRLVLYGSRPDGHANACLAVIEELPGWSCAGFLDDFDENAGNTLRGIGVIGGRERLAFLRDDGVDGVVLAIGNGAQRLAILEAAQAVGLEAPPLLHPNASIAPTARIGPGAVVLRGALIGDRCDLKAATLVNMGAVLTHDVTVGAGATIEPGAVLTGRSRVEVRAHIGANATLLPDARIEAGAAVDAGSVVHAPP